MRVTSLAARHWRAFLVGLQFLTTLPTPKNIAASEQDQGLSLLWYPAIGLLLGLLLTLVSDAVHLPFYLQAIVLLTCWVLLTGGLHLDGLADCADAWVGGMGDREKTLELLKDPLCGSMGVIALVILLLLKTMALAAVSQAGQMMWFWTVPVLARLSLLLLFLTTDYVRPEGLGHILNQHFSRPWAWRILCIIALLSLVFLPTLLWCAFAVVFMAVFLIVRWAAINRLDGFTGDVAGAQVELMEIGLLLTLACLSVA